LSPSSYYNASRHPTTSTQGSAGKWKTPDPQSLGPSVPLAESEETPETTGSVPDALNQQLMDISEWNTLLIRC